MTQVIDPHAESNRIIGLYVAKQEAKAKASAYDILVEASEAAEAAVKACRPTPMIVGTPTTPLGNVIDETKETWFVEGGVCGFASVIIKPARGKFVTLLKTRGVGRKSYYGGWDVSSWEFAPSIRRDQSYERACAAAAGAVKVLQSYGINAYVDARID
jgi:hypothetical protein